MITTQDNKEDTGVSVAKSVTFTGFAKRVYPSFRSSGFHDNYYRILELFARGAITRLMVSVPPQHGKSLGSSVLLPAYILGLDPDLKIALASYNATLATRFNKRIQRILDSEPYRELFPGTRIKSLAGKSEAVRTATQCDIIGRHGELTALGREGSLTGNEVDIFILDDLYKDAMEANSPVIRDNCWEWYTSVVRTRMHNDSREIIVFTRWHEEDLIGMLLKKEKFIVPSSWKDIEGADPRTWIVLNYEAIKEGDATELDPRKKGEPLWPRRHNLELLNEKRSLDPYRFECMYQGRPSPRDGLLYGGNFSTYNVIATEIAKRGNYTDTADLGEDYLCSVCYSVGLDGLIYITDVVYSRDGMEVTESLVADMLNRNDTRQAWIESNNGGRGFARAVGKLTPVARISWFHQSGNKEARILSNSSTVMKFLRFPAGWENRWPEFHNQLITYRRLFRSNRWHDAPDVLTGIIEKEISGSGSKKIRKCAVK